MPAPHGSDGGDRLPTFLKSDRVLARLLARPVVNFLHVEAAGGILLLLATAAALVWANSPWDAAYRDLWATEVNLEIGDFVLHETLLGIVNDGLMALFFFVVGLEIKRELVAGQLRRPRSAVLPVIAAVGGMAVPALVYAFLNVGGEGSSGWGIPMATDIAFALGVVSLLGPRVPGSLKIFLLTLAIVDDIGAIAVIAVFYTSDLSLGWLALAVGGLAATVALRRLQVWYVPVYVVVGLFVWLAAFESGIHATIAGVALGLLTPARPLQPREDTHAILSRLQQDAGAEQVGVREVRSTAFLVRESVSVAERMEDALHPWTSYAIIPLFALANAGIALSPDALSDAAGSAVTIGVFLGLVVGKVVGVAGFTLAATRLGVAVLPPGMRPLHVVGLGAVAGIGFTVSMFIAGLAFADPVLQDDAKLGILVASIVAAVAGAAVLLRAGKVPRHAG